MKGNGRRETPGLAEIDEIIAAHSDFLRSRMQAALIGLAEQAKPAPSNHPRELRGQATLEERAGAGLGHSAASIRPSKLTEATGARGGNDAARATPNEILGGIPDKLFRVLVEQMPEALFLLDPHNPEMPGPVAVFNGAAQSGNGSPRKCAWTLGWPIIDCNEAACREFGYRREELLGQPVGLTGPLTDHQEFLSELLEQLQTETVVRFPAFHRRKDGTYFRGEVSSTLIREAGREWVLSLMRDTAERAQTHGEAERLAAFARHNPHPILEFGAEGELNYFNTAAQTLAHSAGEEMPLRVAPPGTTRIVQECLATGKSRSRIVTRVAEQTLEWSFYPVMPGRVVYALAREMVESSEARSLPVAAVASGDAQEFVGRVRSEFDELLAAIKELLAQAKPAPVAAPAPVITAPERVEPPAQPKPSEAESALALDAFRKRETSFRMAQQIAHVGSWELDLSTGKLEWSDETFRVFGCQPGEITPASPTLSELVHPAHRDAWKQLVEEATQSGKAYNSEHRILRHDGSERWVYEQTAVQCDDAGKPARLFGTIQDITQRKQQEEHLRNVEKWEAIGRLAGGVAHDFNKILTDIRECAKVIQSTPNIDGEAARQLKQLSAAAERATNLTWHLLSLSRKQGKKATYLELNDLIHQIMQMLQHVLGPAINVELKLAQELPKVPGDSSMLEQVMLNLAINSRYAMPKGGRLIIETRLTEIDAAYVSQQPEAHVGKFVCLRISDSGGGVDAARMSCLHEPFFTTKDLGQGTGLGLATVHGIIKGHQGWVDVVSEVGSGTTFKVYLPTQTTGNETLAMERPQKPICGGSETILLVEGDALLRALARSILQRYGYQILEAGSGPEAVALWEKHLEEIALLLIDMSLPDGVKGREFAQQLQDKKASLKILYTSGYSQDLTQHCRFLKPGLTFLPKPYSATALAQAVRHCLDRADDTGASPAANGSGHLPVLYEAPLQNNLIGDANRAFNGTPDASSAQTAEVSLSMA